MGSAIHKAWKVLHQHRVYITVEPILLVFMFSQFLSFSVFQVFLLKKVCELNANCSSPAQESNSTLQLFSSSPSDHSSDTDSCRNVSGIVDQQVQAQTSHWILYINIATGLPSIILSIFYGSLSDLIGRRLFIVLPTIGAMLNTAVILVVNYIPSLPIHVLLVGAFFNGVYGSYSVINFAAYSYASDVSAHSGRTRQIGVLESMTYLGATFSQIVGGVWVYRTTSFAPLFWFILACQALVMLYTIIALPESLKLHRRNHHLQYHPSHRNHLSHRCLKQLRGVGLHLFRFLKLVISNWKLALLILTFFVVEINFLGITDVVIIYAHGEPLCWNFDLIGYFLAAKVFLNGIASLIFLPILGSLKVPDTMIVLIGLLAGAAALLIMGLASVTWVMFLGEYVSVQNSMQVSEKRKLFSVSNERAAFDLCCF